MNKQSVYFLINSLRTGGAEKICIKLANEFNNRGIFVTIIVLNLNNAQLYSQLDSGVQVIDLKVGHTRQAIFRLKKVLSQKEVKTILVFTFQLAVLLVMLKKIFMMDFRIFARSINSLPQKIKYERNLYHKIINKYVVKNLYFRVDHIIAQSTGMAQELKSLGGKSKTSISTIFNFIEPTPGRIIFNKNYNKLKRELLFVGKLMPQKNVQFLIHVISFIVSKNQNILFRIVGEGKEADRLRSLSKQLNLERFVSFEGKSTNVDRYYQEADLFLLGSHYEGFPNVILEAMSHGLPVISVDCPNGPSDILIHGKNGFLVKDHNVKIFGDYVLESLNKKWDKKSIIDSISKFNKDQAVDEYLEVLNLPYF